MYGYGYIMYGFNRNFSNAGAVVVGRRCWVTFSARDTNLDTGRARAYCACSCEYESPPPTPNINTTKSNTLHCCFQEKVLLVYLDLDNEDNGINTKLNPWIVPVVYPCKLCGNLSCFNIKDNMIISVQNEP